MRKSIFILFLISNIILAQNLHVEYLNQTSKYTNFKEDLYISNNKVLSIRDSIVNNSFDEKKAMNSGTNEAAFFIKEKLHKIIYYKNFDNKVIFNNYINGTNYYIEDLLPKINWNTSYKETKTIAGYLCNKATLEFRGSNIIAFYSKKLNYNSGPYKFQGLNGLILEIRDNDNPEFNSWIAISVEENNQSKVETPSLPENVKTISLKDFLELKNQENEKKFNKMIGGAPSGTVFTNKKIIRGGIEKNYEWEK
ncbi:GLPGLI family protein [Halpernia frigidisoli]|uniref:GLPGLI family protein n=1 Tax=Halpernia frigidisoli TaxID=1125876 RepID=A0A1I3IHN7_9FLAO|nr:GLPGLI family protein [Halpernia frigidisoli]SFI47369.1 GLPGLI family protein [Halpernia frigidisoli]